MEVRALSMKKAKSVADGGAVIRAERAQHASEPNVTVRSQREQNEVSGFGVPQRIRVVFPRENAGLDRRRLRPPTTPTSAPPTTAAIDPA